MLRWLYDKMLMQSKFISFLAHKKSEEVTGEEEEKEADNKDMIILTSDICGWAGIAQLV